MKATLSRFRDKRLRSFVRSTSLDRFISQAAEVGGSYSWNITGREHEKECDMPPHEMLMIAHHDLSDYLYLEVIIRIISNKIP